MTRHMVTALRRPGRLVAAAALGSALVLGAVAVPSAAADDPGWSTNGPLADLTLSLSPTAAGPMDGASRATTVRLTCTPDGGTHPSPKAACDSLRRVGGRFELLPSVPGTHCPDVWDPHTARASGYWSSSPTGPVRRVDYTETFGNRCKAAAGTGNVFAF